MSESGLPTPPGVVKRGRSGGVVHFKCPGCGESLRNPLSEAGRSDRCPECGAGFLVPCDAERAADEARHAREAKRRHEVEAAEAKRKQAELLAAGPREPVKPKYQEPPPPISRRSAKGDEDPAFIRLVGAVLITCGAGLAIAQLVQTRGLFDEPSLGEMFAKLGHTIANATIFLSGVLAYATGTIVRVLYQVRDR